MYICVGPYSTGVGSEKFYTKQVNLAVNCFPPCVSYIWRFKTAECWLCHRTSKVWHFDTRNIVTIIQNNISDTLHVFNLQRIDAIKMQASYMKPSAGSTIEETSQTKQYRVILKTKIRPVPPSEPKSSVFSAAFYLIVMIIACVHSLKSFSSVWWNGV
jgi:hypothetical protein